MKRTVMQNSQLYLLLSKLGIDRETKGEMVLSFTDNRTIKSSEMTKTECQSLINDLNHKLNFDPRADKMRKKVISQFIKMGYTVNGKIDMVALDVWCQKYGHQHKPLNSYAYDELPKLVTQAENMYYSFIRTV